MAGTKRKDHGLFEHPNLPQGPLHVLCGASKISLVRGIWILALAIITLAISVRDALPDHSYLPQKIFNFTGSPAALHLEMKEFVIYEDGALYFRLKSLAPAGTAADTVGFVSTNDPACPARYFTTVKNPTVGQTYGPYYMEAGTYKSYYLSAATTLYELEIEYHPQLTPNDAEPNDLTTSPSDIGDIDRNEHITGHLGYLGCKHSKQDYIRFGVLTSGKYRMNIHYDPAFSAKTGCEVCLFLSNESPYFPILNRCGPPDAAELGPVDFKAGNKYLITIWSSMLCYDEMADSGWKYIVNNKAGAYDVQIYDPLAPPPPTLRLAGVEKAKRFLYGEGNQKYLIVSVENTGTAPQSGYVEIEVVDEDRNQLIVVSDNRSITVPAAGTSRYEFYADTTNWPPIMKHLKATVRLYTTDKQQLLGSGYSIFGYVETFRCDLMSAIMCILVDESTSIPTPGD